MLRDFTWCINAGASKSTSLKTNVVQFGDGYEQVSSFGINNAHMSWQCSKTAKKPEIDAIERFLLEHKGVTPFYMNIIGDKKTYRTDGDISTSHDGADIWTISFTVKQVFIP